MGGAPAAGPESRRGEVMSYTIEQLLCAVERERDKWRSLAVFWKDSAGNVFPVPVVATHDDGDRIHVEIERQQENSDG